MSRCAILPAIGDPALMLLWYRQYEKTFKDHVDSLYVLINSEIPRNVLFWVSRYFTKQGAEVIDVTEGMISHGNALRRLFDESTEDLIMLVEDDCFIFDKDIVDACFRTIEKDECDLVGSPRHSCATEVSEAARIRWNLDYSKWGDTGPNFWPNCLFVKRKDLAETDLHFGERAFNKGEYIPYLDHTMKETGYGDTLVHMSLQLRNLGLRIKEVPQHHGSTYEVEHFKKQQGLWVGGVPWTHSGSSSNAQATLARKLMPEAKTLQETLELERRFAWWLLAYEMFVDTVEETEVRDYMNECRKHLGEIILRAGLSNKNIRDLVEGYGRLI